MIPHRDDGAVRRIDPQQWWRGPDLLEVSADRAHFADRPAVVEHEDRNRAPWVEFSKFGGELLVLPKVDLDRGDLQPLFRHDYFGVAEVFPIDIPHVDTPNTLLLDQLEVAEILKVEISA